MKNNIISIRNLGKKYSLGERQPYYSFRDTLSNIFKIPFKNNHLKRDEFWALDDLTLDINEGEVVGIIGRNGAGKSTFLKILSQITPPTTGEIRLKGRVASLLEVGTGFHPELTGRENIFLNGAILGMKRSEISQKFQEIVDFAEIEKFLDTPVKHYSSGMYMRLAFSVAAHLEPEILIVDEVLAVGDTEFQRKCLGKMNDLSKGAGRTLLFVSHNLVAIKSLCDRVILLENGRIISDGNPEKVISKYIGQSVKAPKAHVGFVQDTNKSVQFIESFVTDKDDKIKSLFECDESVYIHFSISVNHLVPGLYGYLNLNKEDGTLVFESDSLDFFDNQLEKLPIGIHHFKIRLPERTLSSGKYYIYLAFSGIYTQQGIDEPGIVSNFTLIDNNSGRGNGRKGYFSTLLSWTRQENE